MPHMPEMAADKTRSDNQEIVGVQAAPQSKQPPSDLSVMINSTVIVLSLAAQYTPFFDVIAFRPSMIISFEPIPQLWTLVTCNLFESSIFFLCLHLLLLNYLIGQLDHVWTRSQFTKLVLFAAFWTSILRLGTRLSLSAILDDTSNERQIATSYMAAPYCSINHLILIVLMGCRQSYPER